MMPVSNALSETRYSSARCRRKPWYVKSNAVEPRRHIYPRPLAPKPPTARSIAAGARNIKSIWGIRTLWGRLLMYYTLQVPNDEVYTPSHNCGSHCRNHNAIDASCLVALGSLGIVLHDPSGRSPGSRAR